MPRARGAPWKPQGPGATGPGAVQRPGFGASWPLTAFPLVERSRSRCGRSLPSCCRRRAFSRCRRDAVSAPRATRFFSLQATCLFRLCRRRGFPPAGDVPFQPCRRGVFSRRRLHAVRALQAHAFSAAGDVPFRRPGRRAVRRLQATCLFLPRGRHAFSRCRRHAFLGCRRRAASRCAGYRPRRSMTRRSASSAQTLLMTANGASPTASAMAGLALDQTSALLMASR